MEVNFDGKLPEIQRWYEENKKRWSDT